MHDHRETIAAIDDLLRVLQRFKVTHDMWDEADLERLRVESELIELRTRCQRRECSPALARERVHAQSRRISARTSGRRRHRSLDARLSRLAIVQPWYRDLLLLAVMVASCAMAIIVVLAARI